MTVAMLVPCSTFIFILEGVKCAKDLAEERKEQKQINSFRGIDCLKLQAWSNPIHSVLYDVQTQARPHNCTLLHHLWE